MLWKKTKDFSNYSVSNTGLVRNDKFNRILSFSEVNRGLTTYRRVTLFIENKRHYKSVHRLVAEVFIPNPLDLPQVDHIDGDGTNNNITNLQWVTGAQNVQKSFAQNPEIKLRICISGGLLGGATNRTKAIAKYKAMLLDRFVAFHTAGEIYKDACVAYKCACGTPRTASIMWKELRVHKGKCPVCSNTVNRSNPSLR